MDILLSNIKLYFFKHYALFLALQYFLIFYPLLINMVINNKKRSNLLICALLINSLVIILNIIVNYVTSFNDYLYIIISFCLIVFFMVFYYIGKKHFNVNIETIEDIQQNKPNYKNFVNSQINNWNKALYFFVFIIMIFMIIGTYAVLKNKINTYLSLFIFLTVINYISWRINLSILKEYYSRIN